MRGVSVVAGREICDKTKAGKEEYLLRTVAMAERQGWMCALCHLPMWGSTVSFEHQDGRGMGGSNRDDAIEKDDEWYNAATHIRCNGEKGSRRYRWSGGLFVPVTRP